MIGGPSGIYKKGDKYKVQFTRFGRVHNVGLFVDFDEAVQARAAFLESFDANQDPEPYTTMWWLKKKREQAEKFKSLEGIYNGRKK